MTSSDLSTAGTLQIYWGYWVADFPDPWDFLSYQMLPESPQNANKVSDPEATALLRQADTEVAATARAADYHAAERILIRDVAWLPIDQPKDYYITRSYVRGYVETPLFQPSLDTWRHVYIARH